MFKALAMLFMCFYIYIYIFFFIFNLDYPKKLEATFSLMRKIASNFRSWQSPIGNINMADVRFERKERTCLKVLSQLCIVCFLSHPLLLLLFKEKTEPCSAVEIFLWNVFDRFQSSFLHMKKPVFPKLKNWLKMDWRAITKTKKTVIVRAALHKLEK